MRIRMLVSTAALLALSAGAMATPQESVTFTSVNSASNATGTNTSGHTQVDAVEVRTNTFAGTYTTKKILLSGSLTQVIAGNYASEANIWVVPPVGAAFNMTPISGTNGFTGTINIPANTSVSLASPWVANSSGLWTFRFYETYQDGAGAATNSTWGSITITLDDGVVAPPTPIAYDFGNVDPAAGFTGTSGNIAIGASQVKWFKFVLASNVSKAGLSYLDIDTEGSVLTAANDTNIALYNSTGSVVTGTDPFTAATVTSTDDNDGSGLLSALSYGREFRNFVGSGSSAGLVYNGRDGINLAADTYYLAVVGKGTTNTFAANYTVTSNSANTGNVVVNLRSGTYANSAPETTGGTVVDLGTLGTCGVSQFSGTLVSSEIKWYKFTLAADVSHTGTNNGTYLDLHTAGSALVSSNDTEIAVYNGNPGPNFGNLIAYNDDMTTYGGTGFLSMLSFGEGSANGGVSPTSDRAAIGTSGVFKGANGNLLAGTYYFCAGAYNTYQNAGFDVVSTSTNTGTFVVNIKFGNLAIPPAGEPVSAPTLATFDPASFGPSGGSATASATTASYAVGDIKWYKIVLSSGATAAGHTFLDIDTETSAVAATSIALYSQVTGNAVIADNNDGSGTKSQLTFGVGGVSSRPAVGDGSTYNGRDGDLAAGTYYLAVTPYQGSFNNGYLVTNCSSTTGTITINAKAGYVPVVAPTPTYTFTTPFSAPGTCSAATQSSPGETLAVGGINWYKFTVPAIDNAAGTYCDITTNGSTLDTNSWEAGFLNDTMLQMYTSTGTAIGFNDEAGADSCSAVSYGATSPTRTYGGSDALAGANGATMAAGDYYAAVFEYDGSATTAADFVVNPGAGHVGGTTVLNVTVGKNAGAATNVSGSPSATPLTITSNGTSLAWTSGSVPVSGTGIQWFSFTAPDLTVARSYLDFDMEGTTGVTNTALAIFTAAGAVEDSDTSDGTLNLPQLSYGFALGRPGPGGDALSYNGRDGTLTAGDTYYLAVVVEQSDAPSTFAANWSVTTPASCAAAPSGTAFLRVRYGTVPPPAPPTVDANLGTVSVANSPQATASMPCPVSTFRWVHFKTVGATDATTHFVDIHAYGSVLSGALPNDTEMGLYDSTGALVASNDDFTETGSVTLRESVLSYGKTGTVRDYSAHPIGVQGQNGAVLAAGDYYIAIGAYNMDFNAEFGAVATDTVDNGTVMVTVITNTQIPPCNQADIAGLGGSLGSDGILTVDDLVVFLSNFFSGNLAVADLTNLGGTGAPDGLITVDDLVFFLSQFFSPCNP